MSDTVKVGFVPLSTAPRGILVAFCDESLRLGAATDKALGGAAELIQRAAAAARFKGKDGAVLDLLAPQGIKIQRLLVIGTGKSGDHKEKDFLKYGGTLAGKLNAGTEPVMVMAELPSGPMTPDQASSLAAGIRLRAYRFDRYKTKKKDEEAAVSAAISLAVADVAAAKKAFAPRSHVTDGVILARDLVNTPSNDMGPEELEPAAKQVAERFGARFTSIIGDDLLQQNFPLIHAVGRASTRAPRLIELIWGDPAHPKVTLVGKGVCFDTGGLDLKPSSSMLLMKKDMGGAANVLALAQMVMDAKLKLHLRVLIPTVENAVAGNAFRPLDVFPSRKGLTVEIGNTDAEGRLILADALALADEDKPDLLIDMGTLTGAARVALGPDLPPFYTQDETLAADVARCAASENDPLWRMPLWAPYDSWLDSKVATLNNAPSGGFAGSITCALFLQRFVEHARSWLHLDIFAWTPSAKPGRPEGGECQAARALYKLLSERYG